MIASGLRLNMVHISLDTILDTNQSPYGAVTAEIGSRRAVQNGVSTPNALRGNVFLEIKTTICPIPITLGMIHTIST
jgi:hypothetical protein